MSRFKPSKSASVQARSVSKEEHNAASIEMPAIDPNTCALPEAYYHDASSGKDYLFRVSEANDRFIRLNVESLRRQLRGLNYSNVSPVRGDLSEIDILLNRVQIEHQVAYAGPLAGHRVGLYETGGQKVLVTDSPAIIEPEPGDWKMLDTILENMLGEEQEPYFLAWLKVAYEALRSGNHRPGQALFLAGPPKSGKSLLQQIISAVLGGTERVAEPYMYMTGGTTFNTDLFRAEHLVIDDHPAIKTTRDRQLFTDQLKWIVNPQPKRCHGKGANALVLNPFWRLSISINDSDSNLAGFLQFDDGVSDKLMLFKTQAAEMPMPSSSDAERVVFFQAIRSQLPHMLYTLTHEWSIPDDYQCSRFGVTHYHHPEILSCIERERPEERLLEVIDAALFSDPKLKEWEGLSAKLENELRIMGYRDEVQKLFTYANACGSYLGKLEKTHPNRVTKHRVKGVNNWRIFAPSSETESTSEDE